MVLIYPFNVINSLYWYFRLRNNDFLNDSFIDTPSENASKGAENNQNAINKKTETINFNRSNLPMILEKGESSAESFGKRDSTSRQLNFDDSDAEIVNKKEPDRPKISLFSKIQSTDSIKKSNDSKIIRAPDASWKAKPVDAKNVDSLSVQFDGLSVKRASSAPEQKLCTESQTPKVKPSTSDDSGVSSQRSDEETPYKTFQIPPTTTMRRLQSNSQHRTLLSSASQPRKCRSELEKEFKSQKVLFTTPSAVTRPAIKIMSHLGLDDSLNCYKSSPMVNLSPVKEERQKNKNESIRGESALRSFDKNDGKSNLCAKDAIAMDSIAEDVASNEPPKSDSVPAHENDDSKKTITINGKDFVIEKKIGQGGSSSVFLVEHKDTKLQCALKVIIIRFIL